MKFTMTKIAAAAVLTLAAAGAQAATLSISSMTFSGGTFFMAGVSAAPTAMAGSANEMIGAYNTFGNQFSFFGGPVNYFTGDGTMTPYGALPAPGGPAPSGTVDDVAGTIAVDLSAFTANWNGTNFNQGNSNVTGTWNSATNQYSVAWNSLIVGGPFNGFTGAYTMTGTAVAVPEASTYGMMLAGLGLVGFAVRRRKLMA